MTDTATTVSAGSGVALQPPRRLPSFIAFFRKQPLGTIGGLILVVMVLTAIFADYLTAYNPTASSQEAVLQAPGPDHVLGADQYGRDVLSRLIYGSRISLYVSLVSIAISTALGAIIGLVSGYWAGKLVDTVLQRAMDGLMAFPTLVLAMAIVISMGVTMENVILSIGVVMTPRTARVVRGSVMSAKENQYVEAARAIGCGDLRIIRLHLLPNVFAPIIIMASIGLGNAIMMEGSLSFLGYGVPPPEPSWGGMLSIEGRAYMERAPWIALFPGIALSVAIFAFNLFGDALRDVLDPRLRT